MLLTFAKIFALLFAILVISKSYLAFRSYRESWLMFLFWTVTWLIILALAFFPSISNYILGQQRIGIGSFLGVALVFIYFIVYRIYAKADRLEKQFQDIVRQIALLDLNKNRPTKKP